MQLKTDVTYLKTLHLLIWDGMGKHMFNFLGKMRHCISIPGSQQPELCIINYAHTDKLISFCVKHVSKFDLQIASPL